MQLAFGGILYIPKVLYCLFEEYLEVIFDKFYLTRKLKLYKYLAPYPSKIKPFYKVFYIKECRNVSLRSPDFYKQL